MSVGIRGGLASHGFAGCHNRSETGGESRFLEHEQNLVAQRARRNRKRRGGGQFADALWCARKYGRGVSEQRLHAYGLRLDPALDRRVRYPPPVILRKCPEHRRI